MKLPEIITFDDAKTITTEYDAEGTKLKKIVSGGEVTDYEEDDIYVNNVLYQTSHDEGRINAQGQYEYNITDHRHELIDFIAAVVALIAVGVSFIWPVAGGLVMMLAYIAMATVEKQVFVGPVFPIVFITGMLHVVLHVIHMRSAQVEGQTN